MRIDPALFSFQADEPELKVASLTAAGFAMQFGKADPVLRMNQFGDRAAPDLGRAFRFDHPQSRRIHLQQKTLRRDRLHTLRLVVDNRPQPAFTLTNGFFRLPLLRDVNGDGELRWAAFELDGRDNNFRQDLLPVFLPVSPNASGLSFFRCRMCVYLRWRSKK